MIRFHTKIEDVLAFHQFHYANSPTIRRQVLVARLLVPAILGMMVVVALLGGEPRDPAEWVQTFAIAAAISLGWFFGLPFYQRWMLVRNVRKLLNEGPRSTLVGWRDLELVGERLRSRTELIETFMDLRAIIRIAGNERYTFVYISPLNAIIIPMETFPQDQFFDFIQELRAAWQRSEERRDDPGRSGDAIDDRISVR